MRLATLPDATADGQLVVISTDSSLYVAAGALASVPGGATEKNPTLGRQINVDATMDLIDWLAKQSVPARLVRQHHCRLRRDTVSSGWTKALLQCRC